MDRSLSKIGGFEILEKIGQGGMGAVYRARQISLDRVVALKVLKPSLAKDLEYIARFRREVMLSAKLNHPNIVQAIDAGCDKGFIYFAMEYVEGQSLQKIIDRKKLLDEEEAIGYVRQMAQALVCAHRAGLVHRDIKPDNILVTPDGIAKLADLGLAKGWTDSSLTATGTILGTPYYMSPEQVRGDKNVDGRSDLYSLGATWFHMITGRPPFLGDTAATILIKHLKESSPKASEVNPNIGEKNEKIIEKLLSKDRDKRFVSASIFLKALECPEKVLIRRDNGRKKCDVSARKQWVTFSAIGIALLFIFKGIGFHHSPVVNSVSKTSVKKNTTDYLEDPIIPDNPINMKTLSQLMGRNIKIKTRTAEYTGILTRIDDKEIELVPSFIINGSRRQVRPRIISWSEMNYSATKGRQVSDPVSSHP